METHVLNVRKWGNSGGILVPREWQGKQVEVILVDRTNEIKKEVLEILNSYLEDLQGIYLVGSYARGEQIKLHEEKKRSAEEIGKVELVGYYEKEIRSLESEKERRKR